MNEQPHVCPIRSHRILMAAVCSLALAAPAVAAPIVCDGIPLSGAGAYTGGARLYDQSILGMCTPRKVCTSVIATDESPPWRREKRK